MPKNIEEMTLADTVDMMLSDDYKERFIAEYDQLSIRRNKLMNVIRAAEHDELDGFELSCPIPMLYDQLQIMDKLLLILEKRAVIEEVDLHE